jgi:subtilisin family serine protease
MLRALWLCLLVIYFCLNSVRLEAQDVKAFIRSPEQVTVFRPAGHAWLFFHKRAKIFWLEDSQHGVFSATEVNAIRLFSRRVSHPYSHHIQPWSGAHRDLVLKDDDLSAFAVAPDGVMYFVFSDRIESLAKGEGHVLVDGDFSGVTSVAASFSTVFISDKTANQLLAINRTTGMTTRINYRGDVPDRLVATSLYLYGMNYSERKLVRYSLLQSFISDLLQRAEIKVLPPAASAIKASEDSPVGRTYEVLTVDTLDAAEDFAVYGDTLYVLEPLKSKLTALSFHGGGVHSTNIDGLLGDVRALTSSEAGLVFSDHSTKTFDVLRGVTPATLYTAQPQIVSDMAAFYAYQYRRKLLPFKTVSVASSDDLSRLMGNLYLEGEGKRIFCLLNRSRRKDCEKDFQFPAKVTLPDLSLETYVTTSRVILGLEPYNQTTVGEVAKQNFTGSEVQLRTALAKFNGWYDGPDILREQKGRFEVPITAVQAEGFVSSREKHPPTLLTEALSDNSLLQLPFSGSEGASRARPLSLIPDRAVGHEPQQPTEASWLKIIDESQTSTPAQVAIVDFEFDLNHPLFKPGQFKLYSSNKGVSQAVYEDGQSSTGPEQPGPQITIEDHGTHIAGLIAGQNFNGVTYGVNGGATLQGVYVNDFLDAVTKRVFRIYNISLGENDVSLGYKLPRYTVQAPENLESWILAIKRNPDALFVIAAGNENSNSFEEKLAGVGDAPNALTVMATDSTGINIWKENSSIGSNYGGPTVGIAAPGERLISGTYHGGWAVASGTSQATALVSGAASILAGKYSLQSWQIRDRLIATSNVDSWLQQNAKASLGGLLDVDRAVANADHTVVYFRNVDTPCIGKFTREQSRVELIIDGEENPIHFRDILRLHWDASRSSFRMWYLIHTIKDDFQTSTQLPAELHRIEFDVSQISDKPQGNGNFSINFDTAGNCALASQSLTNISDLYGGFYDPL